LLHLRPELGGSNARSDRLPAQQLRRALMQELRYAEHIEEEATPTQAGRVR
jgi:hypothetical protein